MVELPKSVNEGASMGDSRTTRFWVLVAGIMFFFGCHNYLQELIMSLPGFNTGVFLGYLEVLGVAVCSYVERASQGETTRKAPWSAYFMLCFCLLISSAASNIALSYINYATKVVFRSCKVRDSFPGFNTYEYIRM
jgi:adenosine 3'-phospho 5'-phosphosulfate transporter B3